MKLTFDKGFVNSRDRAELDVGEYQTFTGLKYKPGDQRPWRIGGRKKFGDTGTDAEVKGVALCQSETQNSAVVAYSGTSVYAATPGAAGNFELLKSDISSSSEKMTSTHANDRWYLAFGGSQRNQVLESGSGTSGTVGNFLLIDFGVHTEPTTSTLDDDVETDYIGFGVTPYNVDRGYGWDTAVSAIDTRDRNAPNALTQDFVFRTNSNLQADFFVDLTPGRYRVTVSCGDQDNAQEHYVRDNLGNVLLDGVATSSGSFTTATTDINITSDTTYKIGIGDPTGAGSASTCINWLTIEHLQRGTWALRAHGMDAPAPKTAVTEVASGGTVTQADAASGTNWTDTASSYDADNETFSWLTLSTPSTSAWLTITFPARTTSGDVLKVTWALAGLPPIGTEVPDTLDDTGAIVDSGFNVTVQFQYTEDYSATSPTWTTFFSSVFTSMQQVNTIQQALTDSVALGTDGAVRARLVYNSGSSPATLRVYNVKSQSGGSASTFSTTTGLYYAVAEFDENTGLQSPISEWSALTTISSKYGITVTLPAQTNDNATHYLVYRTADGGTAPYQLGLLAKVPIAESSYVDDFSEYGIATQPTRLYPMLGVTVGDSTQYYPRDTPPPSVEFIGMFRGMMFGLQGRRIYYSMPGLYESWPEIYVVNAIPFPQKDTLVAAFETAGSLVVAAEGTLMRIDDLPRVTEGRFIVGGVHQIKGAPGCVGRYAMCPVSVGGEAHVAWISHSGVFVTNGHQYKRISNNIDFTAWAGDDKSDWVLHFDQEDRTLMMVTDAGTYYLIFMEPEHQNNGQAKVTGPHYGNISDLASDYVSNTYRVYSANSSDGIVYLEDDSSTTSDASNAYDSSGTNPLIVKTPRIYARGRNVSALGASLYHTDFGDAETLTFSWETGRDTATGTYTKTKQISVAGQKRTYFDIAKAGEWHEGTLTYTGSGTGALVDLSVEMDGYGPEGEQGVG